MKTNKFFTISTKILQISMVNCLFFLYHALQLFISLSSLAKQLITDLRLNWFTRSDSLGSVGNSRLITALSEP